MVLTTRTRIVGLTAVAILGLSPDRAPARQEAPTCDDGSRPRVSLNIQVLECNCGYHLDEDRRPRDWWFDTEPIVRGLAPGTEAARLLRVGDAIVAVDGALITTREGGTRWGSLPAGQSVEVRVRRGPDLLDLTLPAVAECRAQPSSSRTPVPVDPGPEGPLPEGAGQGWLGVGLSCSCSLNRGAAMSLWTFWDPPEVDRVAATGPAARAGVRPGDRIVAVDGRPLVSPEGGRTFSTLAPGQRVRLRLERDGQELEVDIVVGTDPDGR